MSTVRVITDPNGRQFTADSMDRFGDNLVELLLSYLFNSDRHRLQVVSKQWQRSVQKIMTSLDINSKGEVNFNEFLSKTSLFMFVFKDNVEDNCNRFKTLLKRYPNVNHIVFREISIDRSILETIADNCLHLKSLSLLGCHLRDAETMTLFGQRLGPKMRDIRISCHCKHTEIPSELRINEQELLAYCPYVESLVCDQLSVFNGMGSDFLPNLKSIKCEVTGEGIPLMVGFGQSYANQLKVLKLTIQCPIQSTPDQLRQAFAIVLNGVSALKELTDLQLILEHCYDMRIDMYGMSVKHNDNNRVVEVKNKLKQMASNCKKLKRLSLIIDYNFGVEIQANIWRCFAGFVAIKSLNLAFNMTSDRQTIAEFGLKSQLKYLTITSDRFDEKSFANINQIVPNLQKLELRTEQNLSDTLLMSLSGLEVLRELSLSRSEGCFKNITDNGFIQLLDNCPKLTKVGFSSRTAMTTKSIERLITFANNTNKCIEFNATNDDSNKELDIPVIDISVFANIPKNLKLSIQNPVSYDDVRGIMDLLTNFSMEDFNMNEFKNLF